MTKITKYHYTKFFKVCLLITLLTLLTSGCGLIEDKNSIDEKTVNEMVAKAKPLIEEIAGRKFKSDLKFKIVNRKEFRKLFEKGLLQNISEWEKDYGEDQAERRRRSAAKTRSKFYIARYFNKDNTVYIIRNNIKPMKKMYDIKKEDLNDFIFIIIAHEMMHGLDNQYYDLAKLLGEAKDEESNRARSAVRGGSVGYVIGEIVDRLKISKRVYKSSLMLDIIMEDELDPRSNEMFNLYFVKGRDFIEAIVKARGMENYSLPFKTPPESTRQVYYPENYFNYINKTEPPQVNLIKLVKKAVPALPRKSNMHSGVFTTGTASLRGNLIYDGISEEKAIRISGECLNGINYQLVGLGFNAGQVMLTALSFTDNAAAVKYDDLLERIYIVKDNNFDSKLNTSYRLSKEDIQKKEAFDCLWFRDSGTRDNGSKGRRMTIAGVIDNIHISIRYENMDDANETDMRGIMDMIYRRYMQLKDKQDSASE